MCELNMALFPAFADVETNRVRDSSKDSDWLNNKSFQSKDALFLHKQYLEDRERPSTQGLSTERLDSCSESEEDDSAPAKKKKKRKTEKKKKRKKNKKKSGRHSGSSGSDSDTVYPSDLKEKEVAKKQRAAAVATHFSWLDDLQSPTEQPFCVDRKADPANWTYKSLYRGDVARYKRKGSSSLGLEPGRQLVTWEDSNKKSKGANKKGADRYFSTVSRQLLSSQPPVPALPVIPESSGATSPTVFLPLGDDEESKDKESGDKLETSWVNPLGVYDASTALWRQGKGQQQTDQEKQEAHAGQSVALLTGRTEEFNRQLREQPSDTKLWMQYIKYQDELSATAFGAEEEPHSGDAAERRKCSHRALLEKKLSIAERAVATNPCSISLQLERLRICQELWEPSLLAKEWKKLVFLHPNSAPLWREYLLFTQSYFSNFTVAKVNAAYGKCLSTLGAVRDGSMVSHPARPGTEEDMLDIFTLQSHFLRQSGHSEKAVSLFQAMIDFTFFKPDSVRKLSTKQQVEFFEPFWDSGEARVGELGARGWKAWMLQQERGGWLPPPAEDEDEDEEEDGEEVKDRSLPRHTIWLDVESSREVAHWLPWRPDKSKGQSEEDCDDPDRQVLFDDIGPSLIQLSSPDLQLRLLLRFLAFLGLPVDSVLCADPCAPGLLLERLSFLTQGNDLQRPLSSQDLLDTGVNSVGLTTTLQGVRKWVGLGKQGEVFLANVLSVLQPVLPARHRAVLALCRMQYEKLKVLRCLRGVNKKRLRSQGKSSKRVAKQLLKEPDNRSSVVLWREFGHLEWLLGNLDEARKVFSTATALAGGSGTLKSPALCELCLLWAQLEVEQQQGRQQQCAQGGGPAGVATSPALTVLTRLAEGASAASSQSISPVTVLKARRSYEQAMSAKLSTLNQNTPAKTEGQGEQRAERLRLKGLVGCYALLQYLTMGIQAANSVYNQAREAMEELHNTLVLGEQESRSEEAGSVGVAADQPAADAQRDAARLASECTAIALQQAALLRYHNSIDVFPLATLRQTLTSSLTTWPDCAPLWTIYVQVENRYHSAGRARRFFHSVSRSSCSVVPRLFAVVAEQQRKQLVDGALRSSVHDAALPVLPENGLSNRIRGLFESTISTETGSHCPLLWRMYIHFLLSEGMVEKAKGIFYKALQHIPWVKGFFLDGVQLFPERMQEFVDLMTEKELRLRLPLEELDILLE